MDSNTIDWLQLILSALGSAFVAGWTVFQFMYKQKQKRDKEAKQKEQKHAEQLLLYVNPFMLAAESLQSRLYNILERGGLPVLKSQDPGGGYAEQTLYRFARYLGWDLVLTQQGVYTEDDRLRQFSEGIRGILATDRWDVKAFCIFRSDQEALGRLVVRRIQGSAPPEFEEIPFHEFRERLQSSPLNEIAAATNILNALRDAHGVHDLPGKERLAHLQAGLVYLLNHLEGKEGFSVHQGIRARARVDGHAT